MNKSERKIEPINQKINPKINPPTKAKVMPFDDGSKIKKVK